MSMKETPEKTATQPGQSENKDILRPRARANRKIDEGTIEAVAALCSRGMTVTWACHQLGIRPKQFFNFKSSHRNEERWQECLDRFSAMRVDQLLAECERAAQGKGGVRHDWRAAKFLLEVVDRKTFNTDRAAVEVNVQQNAFRMNASDLNRALEIAYKGTPEIEAQSLLNEVRLGYRMPESLEWIQTPGQAPTRTRIKPEIRERVLSMLAAKPAVDCPAEPVARLHERDMKPFGSNPAPRQLADTVPVDVVAMPAEPAKETSHE